MSASHPQHGEARFPTRKVASLLAFLAFHPDRDHPRELLIEQLWPEVAPEAGRNRLRVTLSSLRRLLNPGETGAAGMLQTDRLSVRLVSAFFTSDVADFEAALSRAGSAEAAERIAALSRAVQLYRGRLLPGFYEEWVPAEQERLSEAFFRAASQLTALLKQAGQPDRALEYARRAAQLDPLREGAHLEVMRLAAETGDAAGALRQYQELERALAQELGIPPSRELRSFAESLRTGNAGVGAAGAAAREVAAAEASPPALGASHASGLPAPLTPFFGREEELQRLRQVLSGVNGVPRRLLTLTGPPGAGKTRLAMALASALGDEFGPDRWFVPLADLPDSSLLPDRVLSVLSVGPREGVPSLDRLVDALSGRKALVLLDNLEHLLETPHSRAGSRAVVRTLLERLPGLLCVVTSRQKLGLPGEQEYPVAPLPVPEEAAAANEILSCPSVQLYVDRARAVRPDMSLKAEGLAAVGALCRELEGIPLAIELAAARAAVLTPQQTLAQLGDRYRVLVRRGEEAQTRHQTLAAAVEWSFRLLTPDLRCAFARLSVFRGGWSLPAAASVVAVEEGPDAEAAMLDALSSLRECSLVVAEECDGEMRFRMLETLREFAARQLGPEEELELRRRHRDWFLELARAALNNPHAPDAARRAARVEAEQGNYWAALDWGRSRPAEYSTTLRLMSAVGWFWLNRRDLGPCREFLEGLLQNEPSSGPEGRSDEERLIRLRALILAGVISVLWGDYDHARLRFEAAIELAAALDRTAERTHAMSCLANLTFRQGSYTRAAELFQGSLDLKRAAGDRYGVTGALMALGEIRRLQGDYEAAEARFREALAFSREIGDRSCEASAQEYLGCLFRESGDMAGADRWIRQAREIREERGDRAGLAVSHQLQGIQARIRGDRSEARRHLEEAMRLVQEGGDQSRTSNILHSLALIDLDEGFLERAESGLREALRIRVQRSERLWIANSLECLAGLAIARREGAHAARYLSAAETLRQSLGVVRSPFEVAEYEDLRTRAGELLAAAEWEVAWQDGGAEPLEKLLHELLAP